MPYPSVTLLSGGVQDQGESLLLVDSTLPTSSPTSVLVILGNKVSSEGLQASLPLGVSEVGATSLLLPIPLDGLYSFQALRVESTILFPTSGLVGDVVYSIGQGSLYQVKEVDSLGIPTWVPLYDVTFLFPFMGDSILYLHLTGLTKVYGKLLLRYLHYKLGPLEGVNSLEATLLDAHLGRLERGLEGSKYLFQDGNYPEASRNVELLTLTRYL